MQDISVLLAQYGLLLVFANVFLAQLGVPLPAIPLLIVAGALVQQGGLSLPALLGVAVVASLAGDLPWYAAGRMFGYRVLAVLCRVAIEPDSCVKQTETIFERWGAPSLLVAKFIPGFSTVAPPIAGALRLALAPFLAYSAGGALLWAGAAVAAGIVFNAEVDWLIEWIAGLGSDAVLVIIGIIGFYVAAKLFERYLFLRLMRMVRVTAHQLHELMQGEVKPVILDARSALARQHDPRRIPGAIAFDLAAPEAHLGAVPPDRDVVVYCS